MKTAPAPPLSIVILTRNSLGVVERLIEALRRQEGAPAYELIFMDNASSDGTPGYLRALAGFAARVFDVPLGKFSHSLTRMEAARAARGRAVVFFTDDIVPIGDDFLAQLAAPVLQGRSKAAYGVWQINPEWHDPVDAMLHNGWYQGYDDVVEPIPAYCWEKFPPELRRRLINFDNCASCIDRETLLRLEFPPVPYGEDMLFARRLILGGERLALVKGARFYHWHKVRPGYMFRRMCYDSYLSVREFDIRYVSRLRGVLKAIALRSLQRTYFAFFKVKMPLAKKFYWSWYNLRTLTADFFGKYAGVLTAETATRGFSPLKRKLFAAQQRIVREIEEKSILRY